MERTSESASPAAGRPQGCTSKAGNPAAGDRLTGGLWRDAVSLCFLAIAAMIFFWPVVSGTAWLPKGGGDSVSYIFPMYRFAAESLRSGTIPFWNPYQYAGTPFLSDNQSGLFYPFNLLLFLVWPDFSYRAIEMLVIFHFLLAGAAMYCCLRFMQPEAPIRRPAALLGALAFMFSDVFITHIGNLNLIAVAAWLPLAFLGLRPLGDVVGDEVRGLAVLFVGHVLVPFVLSCFDAKGLAGVTGRSGQDQHGSVSEGSGQRH